MATARVQGTGVRSASTVTAAAGQAVTFTSTTTTGSLLVIGVTSLAGSGSTAPAFTVTDSKGNTYSAATNANDATVAGQRTQIWFCPNATGGTSHAVTVKPDIVAYLDIAVLEVSGAATASAQDGGVSSGSGSASTTPSAGTLTVAAAGAMCFAVLGTPGAVAQTFTPGSGWTNNFNDPSSATIPIASEYQVAGSNVTANYTMTSDQWSMAAASFKAAAAGAAFVAPPPLILRQAVKRAAFY